VHAGKPFEESAHAAEYARRSAQLARPHVEPTNKGGRTWQPPSDAKSRYQRLVQRYRAMLLFELGHLGGFLFVVAIRN
jgi:hypothetical protein